MREKTTEEEQNREEEGRGAAALIDGTIWKRREAGSLMSLRIDEDKTGTSSRDNNFALLFMGRVLARPASDGQFPQPSSVQLATPLHSTK